MVIFDISTLSCDRETGKRRVLDINKNQNIVTRSTTNPQSSLESLKCTSMPCYLSCFLCFLSVVVFFITECTHTQCVCDITEGKVFWHLSGKKTKGL